MSYVNDSMRAEYRYTNIHESQSDTARTHTMIGFECGFMWDNKNGSRIKNFEQICNHDNCELNIFDEN